MNSDGDKISNFTARDIVIPMRKADCHKGNFGKVCILAGSPNYPGAGYLALRAARAALCAGAGYAKLCVAESLWQAYAARVESEILATLPDKDGELLPDFSAIDDAITGASAVVAGPGLSGAYVKEIILHLIQTLNVPLVLDAGALNVLADDETPFAGAKDVIISPHLGEFSRLIKKPISQINPEHDAVSYATSQGITVHLKGNASITAYPDGRAVVTREGTPALAKAGSGDVLSGIIGATLAMGISEPVPTAAVIHGLAARLAEERYGQYGVLSADVIEQIACSVSRLKSVNE